MSQRKGFTLIELLVVISIIALLISILLPAMKKSRDVAKTTICLANLRGIGQAQAAYEADEDRLMVHLQELERTYVRPTQNEYFPNKLSQYDPSGQLDVRPLYTKYMGNTNFLSCPFVAYVDRSLSKFSPGALRVYGSYIFAQGYWADYDAVTSQYDWSKLWIRSQDQWTYAGYQTGILSGDMFFREDGNRGYRFNHPGAVPSMAENIHQGSPGDNYCDSFFQTGIVPYNALERTNANFVLKDGSAANYQGSDERLIEFHNSGQGAGHYLTPVLR